MDSQLLFQALLFVIGIGLLISAPQGGYQISIEERVSQYGVPNNATVIEYKNLSANNQDAFDKALAGEEAKLNDPPEKLIQPSLVYIHYREFYYKISLEVSDRNESGQVWLGLLTLGVALIWAGKRYTDSAQGEK